jgi:glycosyltransferase involved in cell wall biosynthesis
MILLSHPTGNTFFRAAARAFYSAGMLREMHSSICWDQRSLISQLLPQQIARQLTRRSFADVPLHLQYSHPFNEVFRLVSSELHLSWLTRHEVGLFSVDAVYRSFDQQIAGRLSSLDGVRAVYCYEDCALSTFKVASTLGCRRIYDLPIGYWRSAQKIYSEERELKPDWSCTLTGLTDSPVKLARKDEELQLADLVIVPSHFVHSTLLSHHAILPPIVVIPFGSPPPRCDIPQRRPAGPLRVLYVGSLGQRKGLSYALDAVEMLGSQVSLTLIGRITSRECRPLMTAIDRHRWIETLPHHLILEQMREHDVLLLPSLFEGYALVISEALSQGLPVITTSNSGGSTVIRNCLEGFIVPIRDSKSIAVRLQQLVDNPDLHATMRLCCMNRAQELSWVGYEQGLVSNISTII